MRPSPAKHVLAAVQNSLTRGVERERDVVARAVAGGLDRLDEDLQRLLVRARSGAKPPSSPTAVD